MERTTLERATASGGKRRRRFLVGIVALLLALVLTVASAAALLLNLSRLRASQQEVQRSNTVLTAVAELHEAVRAAETGQRGYLLTGERRYLATYEAAVPRIWADFRMAQSLARDREQIDRLARLKPVIEAKLDELAQTVALRAQSLEAALQVVRDDRGQLLMEQIDAAVRDLRARGAVLADERIAREQRDAAWTATAATLTGGLALVSAISGLALLLRQRARERLFEAEERFRALAENIEEVFWIADPRTGDLIYVSPVFERVWGHASEAIYREGHLWLASVLPEDRDRVRESYSAGAREGRYDETYRISRPDGSLRWIRDRGWPVHDEAGEFQYVVGIAEDITAMREAQDALTALNADLEHRVETRTQALAEVNRELDAFAYTISHDLRAPLRAMQGYADALREDFGDVLPAEGQRYTERIMVSAARMEDLIEDILTYSRLSQSEISVRSVPLESAIDRVLVDNAVTIAEKAAMVHVSRPMPAVQASPAVLRQVLNNLVSNALKFTPSGARAEISMRVERDGDDVRLWVEDDGIGIHPDHQERIFEPFQRLHGVESYPGTGIGLAIVRRAVMRMGGRTGVLSKPGEGSRFWIELPASREEVTT